MRHLLFTGLFAAALMTPVMAESLKFDIINKSKFDVTEIYASPVGTDDWEEDMLGDTDLLKSGDTVTATIKSAAKCSKGAKARYDLKFVFEDDGDKDETNNSVIEKNIDLCDTGSYTLSDEE